MGVRGFAGAAAALVTLAAIVTSALPGPVSRAVPAVPHANAASTPDATPAALPLYTQIPVSEARNVVGRATIELTDRGFIPSRFENAINQPITFTLINSGSRPHTFTIDELDVDVPVNPGETTTFTIPTPPRLKRYIYYSDTPEDRALGMTGIMTIFI